MDNIYEHCSKYIYIYIYMNLQSLPLSKIKSTQLADL